MNASDKAKISLDSLIKTAIFEFDLFVARGGRMGYHFLCGTIPFSYNYENKINFLIAGFCHEALKTKAMQNAYDEIIKQFSENIKTDELNVTGNADLTQYEKELHRMLIEEGTVKQSLLDYYEKRKAIEPFRILE